MGDLLRTADAYNWSIARIARVFSMCRQTVSKRLEAADVIPTGTRSGHPVYALKDAAKAIFFTGQTYASDDPEQIPPKDRKDWYEGEKVRIALEIEKGSLVSLDEYREEMARMLKHVSTMLETLPDTLERKCALDPKTITIIQTTLDAERALLAEQLTVD